MQVTVQAAEFNLVELIRKAHAGEEILIAPTDDGGVWVRLTAVPLSDGKTIDQLLAEDDQI
jgi:antitoxin (DNA-binding transcriptional repressor) of toxin-antitoxin stability system